MPEHVIRTPGGRWMSRKEALDYLGLTEAQFRAILTLVRHHGKGRGQRFLADDVAAVGQLWDRLAPLLSGADTDTDDEDEGVSTPNKGTKRAE